MGGYAPPISVEDLEALKSGYRSPLRVNLSGGGMPGGSTWGQNSLPDSPQGADVLSYGGPGQWGDGPESAPPSSAGPTGQGVSGQPEPSRRIGPPSGAARVMSSRMREDAPPDPSAAPPLPQRIPPPPGPGAVPQATPAVPPTLQAAKEDPAIAEATKRLTDNKLPVLKDHWYSRLSMALLAATKLAPYAQQIVHPNYTQQVDQYQAQRQAAIGDLKALESAKSASLLDLQRQEKADELHQKAANYPIDQETKRQKIQEAQQAVLSKAQQEDLDRKQKAWDILTKGRSVIYRPSSEPALPGWDEIPFSNPAMDPTKNLKAYAPAEITTVPPELAPFTPGYPAGSQVPRDYLEKATASYQKQLEQSAVKGLTPVSVPEQNSDSAIRLTAQKHGITMPPGKVAVMQDLPLQFHMEAAQLRQQMEAHPQDPGVLALREQFQQDRKTQQDQHRSDQSYQFNIGELNKVSKPVEDLSLRFSRLRDTLNQRTPQADALIAPELLTVMAGGQGSGLRMNEAEISRIIGGRTNLEALKAALNKWQLDPSKGLSVTEAQRAQINALIGTVDQKLQQKMSLIERGRNELLTSDDPNQHRRVVSGVHTGLLGIDNPQQAQQPGAPGAPAPMTITLPSGAKVAIP